MGIAVPTMAECGTGLGITASRPFTHSSTPQAPTIDSLGPFFSDPQHSLVFSQSITGSWDSFTVELYSDSGLTHLVFTQTYSGIISNTIGGLDPNTPYWIRAKITLSGADSPWSNILTASTDP